MADGADGVITRNNSGKSKSDNWYDEGAKEREIREINEATAAKQAAVDRKEAFWAKIEESDIDEALAAQKEKQAGVYKRRALWANEEWQKTEKSEQTKPLNPKGKSVTWCQEPTKIITDE
ncbi:MAG: hypothetical protein IT346_03735 [Epsilonproteobacteria bacterium]|nr:hypothetical protein [Campylobacterota bacterium]